MYFDFWFFFLNSFAENYYEIKKDSVVEVKVDGLQCQYLAIGIVHSDPGGYTKKIKQCTTSNDACK